MFPSAPELAGGFFTTEPPGKPKFQYILGEKKFLQVFLNFGQPNTFFKFKSPMFNLFF